MRATGAVLRGMILVLGVLAVGAVEPAPMVDATNAGALQSDAPSCIPAEQCCKRCDKGMPSGTSSQQQQPMSEAEQQAQQSQFEQQLLLQRELSTAAPNMPDFTLKDLQFILTFTG